MKKNYRIQNPQNSCSNCLFSLSDPDYSDWSCNQDKTFDSIHGMAWIIEWEKSHNIDENGICDEYAIRI